MRRWGLVSRLGLENLVSNSLGRRRDSPEGTGGGRLSRFVRRGTVRVEDWDGPCWLARQPVAAASGVGGQGGSLPRCA